MVIKETCVARALRRLVLCAVFICRKQSSVDKLGWGVGRKELGAAVAVKAPRH